MAAGATYEPIATQTLGSAAATITFSSIPATYTDLKLVLVVNTTSVDLRSIRLTFNADTATNYSTTRLSGDGSTASSNRSTTQANITPFTSLTSSTIPTFYTFDVFSYAGSTNKTLLAQGSADLNGSGGVNSAVGLWRSTAAITTIGLALNSGNYNTGTTATLYGIKAA
jgi:hypothetical protein